MSFSHKHKIPLTIGVTGHRDIDSDKPELIDIIKSELKQLKKDYPNTPFLIISPLAEGADRLIVKLARECLPASSLIVPLPLPVDLYLGDFASAESKAEFNDLLVSADDSFVLQLPENPAEIATNGDARNRQYAKAGAYVVEHSQILFALWDGREARGAGGTAEVVAWACERKVPPHYSTLAGNDLLDSVTENLIIQINPTVPSSQRLGLESENRQTLSSFQYLNRFNRDAAIYYKEQADGYQQSLTYLLQNEAGHLFFNSNKIRWLLAVYAVSDGMAMHFQTKYNKFWHWIYFIFTVAVICFGLNDLEPKIFYVYLIGLLTLLGLYQLLKNSHYEDRYLDYRALAEGLRVLLFWQLNGIPKRVSLHYLRKHRGVLSWIRHAMMNMEKAAAMHPEDETPPAPEALRLTRKLWIDDQKNYFESRLRELQPHLGRLGFFEQYSFYLTLFITIVYKTSLAWPDGRNQVLVYIPLGVSQFNTLCQVLIGFFGALSLIAETYKTRESLVEIQKQFTLLASLYRRASDQLQQTARPIDEILVDLGCEALQENGEWLWWRRNQPAGPPTG